MIRFKCSKCGKKLKAAEESAGRRVKCTGCQAIERIPGGSQAPANAADSNLASSKVVANSADKENAQPAPKASGHSGPMFGQSATPVSHHKGDREFKSKPKSSKRGRWWTLAVGAMLGLIVASVITYVVIKRSYAIPKFKAEFEAMAEVEFYRRAHGQLEQSRRRLSVMAGAFKAKGSPQGDFSEQHQRLNASIDSYTSNSESLLTQAAMLLAEGKDLHAKSLLVETGKEMQALIVDIEDEVGQFNKKTRR